MARLINGDARVTVQSFDPMNEEYCHDEMTVEQALDFATDEGCPPTVDAIPVEWLEAQIKPYTGDVSDIGKAARNGTIKDIIRKWQKERGEE